MVRVMHILIEQGSIFMSTNDNIKNIYTLSPMQESVLYHSLSEKNKDAYFQQITIEINGDLDIELLERSFNKIIERYDILRSIFIFEEVQQPLQIVLRERSCNVYFEDISEFEEDVKSSYIEELKNRDRCKGFDISKDLLMRNSVLKIGTNAFKIIWSFHHIVLDGWSLSIVMNDFFNIYNSLNKGFRLNEKPVYEYCDYIKWLTGQDKEIATLYWEEYLKDYSNIVKVPESFQNRDSEECILDNFSTKLDESLLEKLDFISKKYNVTYSTILQAAWGIILQRYNNTDDVVFGSVVSGRPSQVKGIEDMVGLFINTIPLRIKCEPNTQFKDLILKLQKESFASRKYDYIPLAQIQTTSQVKQNLINHIFLFENYPLANSINKLNSEGKLSFSMSKFEMFEKSNYDFDISFLPDDGLVLSLNFNTLVYKKSFIEKVAEHYINLLLVVLKNPEIETKDINILSKEEEKAVIFDFNDTEFEYPTNFVFHQLFEQQVEKTPDNIALISGDLQIKYKELNEKANRLARILRSYNIKNDSIVAVLMERSVDTIISILAIQKAGGAYLPIDPEYPNDRILYMLSDSGAEILLTKENTIIDIPFTLLKNADSCDIQIHTTKPRKQIENLDMIPIPDRSLIDYEKYHKSIGWVTVKNTIIIQGTRGCPYNCIYCHKIWPKKHVIRTAEHIFNEIKLYYDIGIRRFIMVDDIFNLNKENSIRFFRLIIENGLNIQLFFPNGVRGDILTKDYIDLMVKAGTVEITIALETASPRLQKLIQKNLDLDKLRENIEYIIKEYPNVIVEMDTMHGFPTETEEEAFMTLDFIKSIQWLDFPYIHILKIYPETDMARLAIENGITIEAIEDSISLGFDELPKTLPFEKSFTKQYQAMFLNEYFLNKERLIKVLPKQMKHYTEEEIVCKYSSYLPENINSFPEFLNYVGITENDLGTMSFAKDDWTFVPDFNKKVNSAFTKNVHNQDSFRILLLDLSSLFSESDQTRYKVVEPPLGLMYLMTYLNKEFGSKICGKIGKSGVDFNSYEELQNIIEDFKPDMIGIRTLTYYKDFFHKTVSVIRQWGIDVPIISGGPYATSSYNTLLKDSNVNLAILGEGELTLTELVDFVIKNDKKMPDKEVLSKINGIAFDEGKGLSQYSSNNRKIVFLDKLLDKEVDECSENLSVISKPNDLAYIIYTSGSTGKPKGVMIENRNLTAYIFSFLKEFNLDMNDVVLQQASYSFDAFVEEFYPAMVRGAKVVIPSKYEIQDTNVLSEVIMDRGITMISCSPLLLNGLNKIPMQSSVKTFISGGDVLKAEYITNLLKIGNVYNTYGPTETTVCASYYKCSLDIEQTVYIGKPVSNYQIYILDAYGNTQPIGIPGELCISGHGVTRGYLNRMDLTSLKYIPNPFISGEMMYKSGDLARWTDDGNIEFLGRIDHQVKIRGFRIELGEIENCLLKYKHITEAIVIDREASDGNKYICAYLTSDKMLNVIELREHISKFLPEFMFPTKFIQVDKMPATINGKIDRKELLKHDNFVDQGIEKVLPTNNIERKVIEIWSKLLENNNIGIHDDFFALGGHSLKATMLLSRIKKEFGVLIKLKDIFENPTVKEFSKVIAHSKSDIFAEITLAPESEYYVLSSSQKRLFILEQMDEISTSYNMPGGLVISGDFDKEVLEEVVTKLCNRHEILRTSFEIVDDIPVQKVHEDLKITVNYQESTEDRINDLLQEFIQPFDMSNPPLIRVKLVKLAEKKHLFLFDMHHIISDGISIDILVREFSELYAKKELPELRIQYKDFAFWQNSALKSDAIKLQEEYWLGLFSGEIPVLDIQTDYPRPAIQNFNGDEIQAIINSELTEKLYSLAKDMESTLYMILLSAYNILLFKYTGQKDIVIGSPIAGRKHADLENLIGVFVNTLAIRNEIDENMTFEDFIKIVKVNALNAFENQDYPFEELVEKLNINRDLNRNPLFSTTLTMQNMNNNTIEINGVKFTPCENKNKMSKFDLTLEVIESEGKILLTMRYATALFKRETIQRMLEYFTNIIKEITENRNIRVTDIKMISDNEERRTLFEFNKTQKNYANNKTIYELFEEQAEKNPEHFTLVHNGRSVTYRWINERANQLARVLVKKRVKSDSIIGILSENSIDMITGILGILKAGGAYLPINPENPMERIQYIIEDSKIELLLVENQFVGKFDYIQELNLDMEDLYKEDNSNLCTKNNPNDLAYVIYTSGSTGNPKGVLVEHKSLVNYVSWFAEEFDLHTTDKIALVSSLCFDLGYTSLYPSLLSGCELHIIPKRIYSEPDELLNYIMENGITMVKTTPSLFNMIVNSYNFSIPKICSSLRLIVLGGEKLNIDDIEKYHIIYPDAEFVNHYGPTETTIGTIYKRIEFDCLENYKYSSIIGKPINNTKAYILDKNLKILPCGAIGEIYIAGDGLARGYLNHHDRNKQSFVTSPFCENELLYKTGDLGRYSLEGNIEFIGRADHQVKIRGYRVELKEIENCLIEFQSITEAIVIDIEDQSSRYLCAYYVASNDFSVSEIRSYLSTKLPEYMIPSYFILIQKLPLMANGKVNKNNLPKPSGYVKDAEIKNETGNWLENKLIEMCKEVLNVGDININSNFFEMGGHSLKAAVLVSKIRKELNIKIPLSAVFRAKDIKELVMLIKMSEKDKYFRIEPIEIREFYPISSAQKRIFIANQLNENSSYNMDAMFELKGKVDRNRIEYVFRKLIERHESLRTSIHLIDNDIIQKIHDRIDFKLNYFEINSEDGLQTIKKAFNKPFDLSSAPLLRVGLVEYKDKYVLLFNMHHIISDGLSINILVNEFAHYYEGNDLPELKVQYKDYVAWHNNILNSFIFREQEGYWLKKLENFRYTEFLRSTTTSSLDFKGVRKSLRLDGDLALSLDRFCIENRITKFVFTLAIFKAIIFKYTNQSDISVGVSTSGRNLSELEPIVGLFLNIIIVRTECSENKTVAEFIRHTNDVVLEAQDNQEYPYDELYLKIKDSSNLNRKSLFSVLFNYMPYSMNRNFNLNDFTITPCYEEKMDAKFDITFYVNEEIDGLIINLVYKNNMYEDYMVEEFLQDYRSTIENFLNDQSIIIKDIDLSKGENMSEFKMDFDMEFDNEELLD